MRFANTLVVIPNAIVPQSVTEKLFCQDDCWMLHACILTRVLPSDAMGVQEMAHILQQLQTLMAHTQAICTHLLWDAASYA